MAHYRIGEVTHQLGISADTLRYYERIGLLPKVTRGRGGARVYGDQELSRLRFVRRAQEMNFTLAEIRQLLELRSAPGRARASVRELTAQKLSAVEARLKELKTLRNELRLLITLCTDTNGACPIIKKIDRG